MFNKDGIFVLNKPTGMSSFYAVKKVQKMLGAKKAGHMGTLDPLGCGVLLVGINKGTKLFDKYLNKTKTYITTFKFGIETDTLDSEGKIIRESNIIPTEEEIKSKIKTFVGKFNQTPPAYSAKKIKGKKAYELARGGVEVELKPKEIEIYDFQFLGRLKENCYSFKIECSSGTYIRSIARDLAYSLNSVSTMVSIIRVKCGEYTIECSNTFSDIENGNFIFIEI